MSYGQHVCWQCSPQRVFRTALGLAWHISTAHSYSPR
jgi:hypothetical protein